MNERKITCFIYFLTLKLLQRSLHSFYRLNLIEVEFVCPMGNEIIQLQFSDLKKINLLNYKARVMFILSMFRIYHFEMQIIVKTRNTLVD